MTERRPYGEPDDDEYNARTFWMAIAVVITLVAVVLAVAIIVIPHHTPQAYLSPKDRCKAAAEDLGFTFIRLDQTGFGSDECWVLLDDGTPAQIW